MDAKPILRSDDLRSENRRRLLDALRNVGPSPPSTLTRLTGLSAASISSLSAQMSDQGIVCSSTRKNHRGASNRGRPQSLIMLSENAGDSVTLNIAIDQLQLRRINYAGVTVKQISLQIDTRSLSETGLLDTVIDATQQLVCDAGRQIHRIGVAFQGIIENDSGMLVWSPIVSHRNINLGAALNATFHVPVTINNDCQLMAEALNLTSPGILGHSFATVSFLHGVGLGLYIHGRPFSGIQSSALELGHLRFEREGALCRCGKFGCIEAYASNYGIERMAMGENIHEPPKGRVEVSALDHLCGLALTGDRASSQAFAIAGAALGEGLCTLFTLLDPMPVALVGRSTQAFELMREGLLSVFRDRPDNRLDIEKLVHCVDDADDLLRQGLAHNTLASLDKQFAYGKPEELLA